MSNEQDNIEVLKCALSDAHREIRDRDQEIALLKTTIEEMSDETAHQKTLLRDLQIAVNSSDGALAIQALQSKAACLQASFEGARQAIEDRDQEIALLKTTIEGFESALGLANEKCAECDRQVEELQLENRRLRVENGGLHVALGSDRKDAIAPDYLDVVELQGIIDRNKQAYSKESERFLSVIADRDRKIEILEDNLDRARSEHLEQLRAIIQMLEPLATHEDKGTLYLSHFGKAAMVYMIQKVIYANIKKLDPNLSTYSNDF